MVFAIFLRLLIMQTIYMKWHACGLHSILYTTCHNFFDVGSFHNKYRFCTMNLICAYIVNSFMYLLLHSIDLNIDWTYVLSLFLIVHLIRMNVMIVASFDSIILNLHCLKILIRLCVCVVHSTITRLITCPAVKSFLNDIYLIKG